MMLVRIFPDKVLDAPGHAFKNSWKRHGSPTAPNRLSDRKHCAQPNPDLWCLCSCGFGWRAQSSSLTDASSAPRSPSKKEKGNTKHTGINSSRYFLTWHWQERPESHGHPTDQMMLFSREPWRSVDNSGPTLRHRSRPSTWVPAHACSNTPPQSGSWDKTFTGFSCTS